MTEPKCVFCGDTGLIEPSWLDKMARYAETPFPTKPLRLKFCVCHAGVHKRRVAKPVELHPVHSADAK